jgi:hypothetical protein
VSNDELPKPQPQQTRREAEELRILATLSAKVRGTQGWNRRGVRGWVFTDELGHIPITDDNRYPDLGARGLICREDVLDPGRKSPLYLNRITQMGEDHLAEREDRDPHRVPAKRVGTLSVLDQETIYIPARAWRGLETLVAAPPEEWTIATALSAFFDTDRKFLENRALIEVRRPEGGKNRGPLYRATALGRVAIALDTETSTSRVQIHVPGLRRHLAAHRAADTHD